MRIAKSDNSIPAHTVTCADIAELRDRIGSHHPLDLLFRQQRANFLRRCIAQPDCFANELAQFDAVALIGWI